jgi:formamidopyrimidine-DNA glycosylase
VPELPEVETMRRGIVGVVGSRIRTAASLPCSLRPIRWQPRLDLIRRRCRSQWITEVGRLGKRVVLQLENGCRLVFEPRMTGLVLLADPPNQTHLRFRLELEGGPHAAIFYWDRRGLGSVACWTAKEWQSYLNSERVGPDALVLSAAEFQARLGRSRRAIKVALLDQRGVAGIGNLYASEILHASGIHPTRPCLELSGAEWARIHQSTLQVLSEAIRHEGSTLSDGTYRNALNQTGGYQNHHRVYGREGDVCQACSRATVRRMVQAQRATFFCPECQR